MRANSIRTEKLTKTPRIRLQHSNKISFSVDRFAEMFVSLQGRRADDMHPLSFCLYPSLLAPWGVRAQGQTRPSRPNLLPARWGEICLSPEVLVCSCARRLLGAARKAAWQAKPRSTQE